MREARRLVRCRGSRGGLAGRGDEMLTRIVLLVTFTACGLAGCDERRTPAPSASAAATGTAAAAAGTGGTPPQPGSTTGPASALPSEVRDSIARLRGYVNNFRG